MPEGVSFRLHYNSYVVNPLRGLGGSSDIRELIIESLQ